MSIGEYEKVKPYIQPDEAVRLAPHSSVADYVIAEAIAQAYLTAGRLSWDHRRLWVNAVIYQAGRIAGIREERARRRERAAARGGGESNSI